MCVCDSGIIIESYGSVVSMKACPACWVPDQEKRAIQEIEYIQNELHGKFPRLRKENDKDMTPRETLIKKLEEVNAGTHLVYELDEYPDSLLNRLAELHDLEGYKIEKD